jgi:excisionase family DNA binding protein
MEYMKSDELAAMLRISRRSLESLIKEGNVPPYVRVGRMRRWDPEIVSRWLLERTAAPIAGLEPRTSGRDAR